ncbi:MAG TPA: hypothetical protein VNM40_00805 [Candidatus Paceibacterota bacterium]|nr:hypothetical protein [Candidatus Paceibacterota bacterium]
MNGKEEKFGLPERRYRRSDEYSRNLRLAILAAITGAGVITTDPAEGAKAPLGSDAEFMQTIENGPPSKTKEEIQWLQQYYSRENEQQGPHVRKIKALGKKYPDVLRALKESEAEQERSRADEREEAVHLVTRYELAADLIAGELERMRRLFAYEPESAQRILRGPMATKEENGYWFVSNVVPGLRSFAEMYAIMRALKNDYGTREQLRREYANQPNVLTRGRMSDFLQRKESFMELPLEVRDRILAEIVQEEIKNPPKPSPSSGREKG